MATKRKRNGAWAYLIQRKNLLPKPIHLTFVDEEEGDRYVAHLEKLLDKGFVPAEFQEARHAIRLVHEAITRYLEDVHVPDSDQRILLVASKRIGSTQLDAVDYDWAERWIKLMKAEDLSPSTIRHYVGALARCFDWVVKRKDTMLVSNPLRMLPKRYATGHKEEKLREERLSPEQEAEVLRILDGGKPHGRERAFKMNERPALKLLFVTALETGMRMKEIHTLEDHQVDINRRTFFLEKTKNGDSRQVPMTSLMVKMWSEHLEGRPAGKVFPWNGEPQQVTNLLSQQFSRVFAAAGHPDFTFHGLRHEATCRLYQKTKLTDVQIAKILGWRSLKMALRYANLRGSDLAEQLW